MSTAIKHREFYIRPQEFNDDLGGGNRLPIISLRPWKQLIRVIEYGAYEQVVKEREHMEKQMRGQMRLPDDIKELARLRAALKQIADKSDYGSEIQVIADGVLENAVSR